MIAANGAQDDRVERRISLEPAIKVLAKPVMAVELAEELERDARPEPMDSEGRRLCAGAAALIRGRDFPFRRRRAGAHAGVHSAASSRLAR
jgi:hypothetical protein